MTNQEYVLARYPKAVIKEQEADCLGGIPGGFYVSLRNRIWPFHTTFGVFGMKENAWRDAAFELGRPLRECEEMVRTGLPGIAATRAF